MRSLACTATVAFGILAVGLAAHARPQPTAGRAPIRILVDSIHAHNALTVPRGADPYAYHNVYGFRRAFGYLKAHGFRMDEVTTGRLDGKRLSGHRILFINLVSADLPPFTVPEIAAIKHYIEGGGSLFVITDHSNCYYNAYKLMSLMEELGIRVTTETACDQAPNVIGSGNGWIAVRRFADHPVTAGLRTIAMETAGTVDDRYEVATTSSKAWGDQWSVSPYGESGNQGFYGNWRKDPGERSGSLGVVLAKRLGRGRIVIVADQNMFGDPFINYADNWRLWLNSIAWLTGDPRIARPEPYRDWHGPRVLAYDQYAQATFGSTTPHAYYNLFVALGRRIWIFGGDDLKGSQDLILFANDGYSLSGDALSGATSHLRAGRSIVILGKSPDRSTKLPGVLDALCARLGQPTAHDENGNQTYSWPGCGKVIMLPTTEPFWNASLPAPEKAPTDEQRVLLDAFAQMLRETAER